MRRAHTPALISDLVKSAAYLALITLKGGFISEYFFFSAADEERGEKEDRLDSQ